MLERRGLILGLLATPFIVRTPGLLMPIKPVKQIFTIDWREIACREIDLLELSAWRFDETMHKFFVTIRHSNLQSSRQVE